MQIGQGGLHLAQDRALLVGRHLAQGVAGPAVHVDPAGVEDEGPGARPEVGQAAGRVGLEGQEAGRGQGVVEVDLADDGGEAVVRDDEEEVARSEAGGDLAEVVVEIGAQPAEDGVHPGLVPAAPVEVGEPVAFGEHAPEQVPVDLVPGLPPQPAAQGGEGGDLRAGGGRVVPVEGGVDVGAVAHLPRPGRARGRRGGRNGRGGARRTR